MKITAHTLVQNEENYIWYAVMSVIDYVDEVLIWDTGSVDKTVEIIKEIKKRYPKKIDFKQVVQKDIFEFTKLRQQMLEQTKSDWLMILDGDEVWWNDAIKKVVSTIKRQGEHLESIVNRYCNVVGDIYHFQEEAAVMYEIDGMKGHLTIRAMNKKIPGLCVSKPHGLQGFYDKNGKLIQERSKNRRVFVDSLAYLHFTNVSRSKQRANDEIVPKRAMKLKYEIGNNFPRDFYYPEAFFLPRPSMVPSLWSRMGDFYKIKSSLVTVPKKIKRRVFKSGVGY